MSVEEGVRTYWQQDIKDELPLSYVFISLLSHRITSSIELRANLFSTQCAHQYKLFKRTCIKHNVWV